MAVKKKAPTKARPSRQTATARANASVTGATKSHFAVLPLDVLKKERSRADRARRPRAKLPSVKADATGFPAAVTFPTTPAVTPGPRVFDPRDGGGARLTTPVRRQTNKDDRCVAHAMASTMETRLCRTSNTSVGVPILSVQHIFEQSGKQVLIDPTAKGVAGGVLEEQCFPKSNGCADPKAHTWRGTVRILTSNAKTRIADMCERLENGAVLIISIPVFANFEGFTGPGVYRATGDEIGAHALCVVGFVDNADGTGAWIVKNSYGKEWGDGGFGKLAWGDPKVDAERVVYAAVAVVAGG